MFCHGPATSCARATWDWRGVKLGSNTLMEKRGKGEPQGQDVDISPLNFQSQVIKGSQPDDDLTVAEDGWGEKRGRLKETCQREGGGALWVLCATGTGAADVKARPIPRNTDRGKKKRKMDK